MNEPSPTSGPMPPNEPYRPTEPYRLIAPLLDSTSNAVLVLTAYHGRTKNAQS